MRHSLGTTTASIVDVKNNLLSQLFFHPTEGHYMMRVHTLDKGLLVRAYDFPKGVLADSGDLERFHDETVARETKRRLIDRVMLYLALHEKDIKNPTELAKHIMQSIKEFLGEDEEDGSA